MPAPVASRTVVVSAPDPTQAMVDPHLRQRLWDTYTQLWLHLFWGHCSHKVNLPLEKSYAGQEATVRTGYGTTDWFQIGKGLRQGCILSLCLFNLHAEYIMLKAGLDGAQLESRLLGEISVTSDMQIIPPLWQKAKRN